MKRMRRPDCSQPSSGTDSLPKRPVRRATRSSQASGAGVAPGESGTSRHRRWRSMFGAKYVMLTTHCAEDRQKDEGEECDLDKAHLRNLAGK